MKHEFKFEIDTNTKEMVLFVKYNGNDLDRIVLDREIADVISLIVEDVVVENTANEFYLALARKEIEELTS